MTDKSTTKATLYLDTALYKTLKLHSVETGATLSALMNEALQAQLSENLDDIQAIRGRLSMKEKPLTYETALKELREKGAL